jgi:hypothetical protein
VDQISSLLTAPEWLLPTPPKSASLANQNLPPCVRACARARVRACITLLSTSTPHSVSLTSGKATEESWAEGGFCMLVKKNNLCQRKVLQQLCCKTCTFQGWAANLEFFVPVDLQSIQYY